LLQLNLPARDLAIKRPMPTGSARLSRVNTSMERKIAPAKQAQPAQAKAEHSGRELKYWGPYPRQTPFRDRWGVHQREPQFG
jgi:hypothetical protein